MTEAPRFNSPEEELAYLRSRLESYGEHAAPSVERIREIHRELPTNPLAVPEVERSIERVKGAPEDAQLDEMIAVSREKGVLHALSVLEKLEDWKHEDDFHDYLAALMKQGVSPRGVPEKGPIYRALDMTLYEVVMPEASGDSGEKENLKTLISSMESFYAGMASVAEEKELGKNHFVIEVANSEGSEEANFFVSVPSRKKTLFEKHLLGVFPSVELREREHDYNIFAAGAPTAAAVASLSSPSAYPLKTYDEFDHDPLNAILSSFRKIPKDGAGAAIQIAISPRGETYAVRYASAAKKLEAGGSAAEAFAERSFGGDFIHELSGLFGSKKKVSDKTDTQALELVRKKLSSPSMAVNLRLAVSAPRQDEAERVLAEIESAFNQFERVGAQKLVWKKAKSADFYRRFTFRLWDEKGVLPLNLGELTSLLHFHTVSLAGTGSLKLSKAGGAEAPLDLPPSGTLLGVNRYQGKEKKVYITAEDRLRHLYVIGQTGTGKSTLLKNIISQDIRAGEGVCMIDPHGQDVLDVLAAVPKERAQDVIYFDPASTERPLALNMLEYDPSRPEEKTFVVNELFNIFQKLYGKVPESMGPMFEQYFRNATMLVIEDPASGSTLLDVSRVLADRQYRELKLSRCRNPVVSQFWREVAEKAGGEAALANIVPYITSKFDVFLANDIMRPIVAQERSSLNIREIMDGKKILLVNLSKGRLGDINANLIGLILVGKILMAALGRGRGEYPTFYLHIDEFQNVTTNSIATILSEARKYRLSLTVAHQFIKQLDEDVKNAVFGNIGSLVAFRVGADDAEYLEKQFAPVFSAKDLMNIDNRHAYVRMLVNGRPEKAFSIETLPPPKSEQENVDSLIELSKLKYGRNRAEVEQEILSKYQK